MQQPSLVKHFRDILILPFTVTVILPYMLYNGRQSQQFNTIIFKIIGVLIGIGGLSLFIYTVFLFRTIGKGTLAPWSPKQKLVVKGPYKYSRNPMITGVFFILLGETFFLHSFSILSLAILFFIFNTVYFILIEEPNLYKRFGNDYLHYKKHVPRWIPRLHPYTGNE